LVAIASGKCLLLSGDNIIPNNLTMPRSVTMQGKQAKIVSPTQERAILGYLATTRYPARDRVIFLFSMKAGLRAKEMASLTWAMVTDAQGQIAEVLHVPNRASKGKTGGRTIPLHPDLQAALVALQTLRGDMATPERPILFSERGGGLSPATVPLRSLLGNKH
jgi:integrase/recombinase XerD